MFDADDWVRVYREVGGYCGSPIDPYYEHQAELLMAEMRRRRELAKQQTKANKDDSGE